MTEETFIFRTPQTITVTEHEEAVRQLRSFDVLIKARMYRIAGEVISIEDSKINNGFFECKITVNGTKRRYK